MDSVPRQLYTSAPLPGWLRHGLENSNSGCGAARPSSALFPSELRVPQSDTGRRDYHALEVADSVFQEGLVYTREQKTRGQETPSQPAPSGTVPKGTELPFGGMIPY